jgi:hypothetical protein
VRRFLGLCIVAVVLAASYLPRTVHHRCIQTRDGESWFTEEADALYHMRRLHRLLDVGAPVAETDPFLNYPYGSAIPWPPYYTYVLAAFLGPWVPEDPQQRDAFIERGVASMPLVFGLATSLTAVAGGWLLAGPAAGLFAGLYHAFTLASVGYSKLGSGDHHAWVSLLSSLMLLLFTLGLHRGMLEKPWQALWVGTCSGVAAGLLLGSWVAGLLYVLQIQMVLAVLMFLHGKRNWSGLVPLGLAFHLSSAAVLLPAILSSPWRADEPFMVVNLSWFHLSILLAGALVFVPLAKLQSSDLWRRRYPWVLGLVLLAVAALLFALKAAPARAILDGFSWLGRSNPFMANVAESRPLVGPGSGGVTAFTAWVGIGGFLLPLAWLVALFQLIRHRKLVLLPWVIAVPLLALQAARQIRFTDVLVVPMAVLLAWCLLGTTIQWCANRWRKVDKVGVALGVAILLAVGVQARSVQHTVARMQSQPDAGTTHKRQRELALRGLCGWLRERPTDPPRGSVLAEWSAGHRLEWAARWPTVATNFGLYVGETGFRAPARFLLTDQPQVAETILQEHQVRYVVITSQLPGQVPFLAPALPSSEAQSLFRRGPSGMVLSEGFLQTIGSRLLFPNSKAATDAANNNPIDFLRLVHVTPSKDPRPPLAQGGAVPFALIYEYVQGAKVTFSGNPGAEVVVQMDIYYREADYTLNYQLLGRIDVNKTLALTIPYATESNGDGVVNSVECNVAGRPVVLKLTHESVQNGTALEVR